MSERGEEALVFARAGAEGWRGAGMSERGEGTMDTAAYSLVLEPSASGVQA